MTRRSMGATLATLAMGLALAGSPAVAGADAPDSDTADSGRGTAQRGVDRTTDAPPVIGTQPGTTTPGPAAAARSTRTRGSTTASATPAVPTTAAMPVSVPASSAPSPTSTVMTPYGPLGQWMINSSGQIADWVGVPYQGKTMLEGINVVFVDSASSNTTQSVRNLNAWMSRAGFGWSAFSSTGYQGVIGSTTFGQQPTGANQAFRDAYFLLANSHGRVFGPYPNPNGPGYIWTASLSRENLDLANLTHGYDSFNTARAELRTSLLGIGATDLGYLDMQNTYNTDGYTTGDADGLAAVIGLEQVLKTATGPRGAGR